MVGLPAIAGVSELAATHSWLPWPDVWPAEHPLVQVVERVLEGDWQRQPAWKLPMLVNGLKKKTEQCTITAYCSQCFDGGGQYTRWSSPVRRGICAADPRYWGPGSVIWMGPPINEVLIIEDTGGAVKGPHRFDVCMEGSHQMCAQIGYTDTIYVPLHRVPPTSRWGCKPDGWEPPVWAYPPGQGADDS
jgi:3D (Asp-Asp-Asp) domain-containing protein